MVISITPRRPLQLYILMRSAIDQHSRWFLGLFALLVSVLAIVLGTLLIQTEDELAENKKQIPIQASGSPVNQRPILASLHEASPPVKSGEMKSVTTTPALAETPYRVWEGGATEVAMEEVDQVTPDAPPFLYEINQSKVSRLDVDQQIAVQRAFEKYLVNQGGPYPIEDLNSLKERSERIKEELSAEVGPMTVHDLMQAE